MRRVILAGALLAVAPSFVQAQDTSPGVAGVKSTWTIMANYVTRAAEAVPEAEYSFKPVETVRSFGEIVGHLAGAQNMFCAAALGEPVPSEDAVEKAEKTKEGLVAALKKSTEYCARAHELTDEAASARIQLFGNEVSKMFVLALNAAHVGEHYGNLVTYMRINGHVPPSSQGQ